MVHIFEPVSKWVECSAIVEDRGSIPDRVKPKSQKWYLMPFYLTLSFIRKGSRVKWSHPRNRVAPFPTPWFSRYWKGGLRVALDYCCQFTYIYIYIYIYIYGGCPSDPMMTFVFYNSSMNMEVATQRELRGTESWTVGALEVSCDHCRGCSAVSLSLAAVSFWHQASSKLTAALWTEPCHLVCPWHIPPGLSEWYSIGFDRVFIP